MYLIEGRNEHFSEEELHKQMALYKVFAHYGFTPKQDDKVLEVNVGIKYSFAKTHRLKSGLVISKDVFYEDCLQYEVDGINGHLIYPDEGEVCSSGIYIPNTIPNSERFNIPSYQRYFERAPISDTEFDIDLDTFKYLVSHGITEEDLKTIPFLCKNAEKFIGVADTKDTFNRKSKYAKLLKDLSTLMNSYCEQRYAMTQDEVLVRNRSYIVTSVHQKKRN